MKKLADKDLYLLILPVVVVVASFVMINSMHSTAGSSAKKLKCGTVEVEFTPDDSMIVEVKEIKVCL